MLALYSGLAALDVNARLTAGTSLLTALKQFQIKHNNELKEQSVEISTKPISNQKEADILLAPDVVYAVRRLMRGLASSRDNAREGFASVLSDLLKFLNGTIKTSYLMNMLEKCTDLTGVKGEEEKDILIGRLFGLLALSRAGCFNSANFSNGLTTVDDLKEVIVTSLKIANKKSYLLETGYVLIANILEGLAEETEGISQELANKMALTFLDNSLASGIKNVDQLWLGIAIQNFVYKAGSSIDIIPFFESWNEPRLLLSTPNMGLLVDYLKESSYSSPHHLHSVWNTVISILSSSNDKSSYPKDVAIIPITDLWIKISDIFFTTSVERVDTGLQLFQKLLPMVQRPDDAALLLNPLFLKTLLFNLGNKESLTYQRCLNCSRKIATFCEENPEFSLSIVMQMIGVKGFRDFDVRTKTKTIQTIMQSLDESSMLGYVRYLIKTFNSPEEAAKSARPDETDNASINYSQFNECNNVRLWAIEQMMTLLRSINIPKYQSYIELIAKFITLHGLFKFKTKEEPSSKKLKKSESKKNNKKFDIKDDSIIFTEPTMEISGKVYGFVKQKLPIMQGCLDSIVLDEKKDTTTANSNNSFNPSAFKGLTTDNKPWILFVLEFIDTLRHSHDSTLHLRVPLDEEALNCLKHGNTISTNIQKEISNLEQILLSGNLPIVSKSTKKAKSSTKSKPLTDDDRKEIKQKIKQFKSFASLVDHIMLITFSDPQEIGNVLSELEECFQKMFIKSKTKVDKDDISPIEVIMDILIGFLAKPSALLRELAKTFTASFAKDLTSKALKLALDVVVVGDDNKPEGDNEAMFEKAEVMDEDEDEDEELINAANSVSSNKNEGVVEMEKDNESDNESESESEAEAEAETNDDVDPEFYNKIKRALGKAAANEDLEESESELEDSDLDDDDMGRFEESIANVFRERNNIKQSKKEMQTQILHLKLRVVDLLDTYVNNCSGSSLQLELIIPLVKLTLKIGKNVKENDLYKRINSFLNKTLIRFKANNVPQLKTREEVIRAIEILCELQVLIIHSPDLVFIKLASRMAAFIVFIIRRTENISILAKDIPEIKSIILNNKTFLNSKEDNEKEADDESAITQSLAKENIKTWINSIEGKLTKQYANYNICSLIYGISMNDFITRRRSKVKPVVLEEIILRYSDIAFEALIIAGINTTEFVIVKDNEKSLSVKEFAAVNAIKLFTDSAKKIVNSSLDSKQKDAVMKEIKQFISTSEAINEVIQKPKVRKLVAKNINLMKNIK